jgi:hypothetical protein
MRNDQLSIPLGGIVLTYRRIHVMILNPRRHNRRIHTSQQSRTSFRPSVQLHQSSPESKLYQRPYKSIDRPHTLCILLISQAMTTSIFSLLRNPTISSSSSTNALPLIFSRMNGERVDKAVSETSGLRDVI